MLVSRLMGELESFAFDCFKACEMSVLSFVSPVFGKLDEVSAMIPFAMFISPYISCPGSQGGAMGFLSSSSGSFSGAVGSYGYAFPFQIQ